MDREKIFEELVKKEATSSGSLNYSVIPCKMCRGIASGLGMTFREAEIGSLRLDVCPERYERNMGTIGLEGQIKLLESNVAVVGLGGLGGLITDLLARAGVGHMILIDGDEFTETKRAKSSPNTAKKGIPFVHGAIGGMWAQVGVFGPDDKTPWDVIEDIPDRGVELETGNPPFTAAFAAALQVALAVETITGADGTKKGVLNCFDLREMGMGMVRVGL